MPDTSHQRERVDEFERNAGATRGGRRAGVFLTRNKESYIVSIRPPKWSDEYKPSRLRKDEITNLESAKFLADTIFHYCGRPLCHFGEAPFPFPRLTCMGDYDTTPARRFAYVKSIAGNGFCLHREAFIQEVLDLTESEEFIEGRERFLNLRNVQVAANPPLIDEAAPDNASSTDEAASDSSSPADETGGDECETPLEDDPEAVAMARGLVASSEVAAHPPPVDEVAPNNASPIDEAASDSSSPADETGGDECVTPLEDDPVAVAMARGLVASSEVRKVAGFEFNVGIFDAGRPGKILESVEQHLGSECYSLFSAVEEQETSNVSPIPPQENQSNIETNLEDVLLAFQQLEQEIFGSSNQQVNMVSSCESVEPPPEDWETDSEGGSIEQDMM